MSKTFYEKCRALKKNGYSEKQMACYFLMSLKEFRSKYAIAKKEHFDSMKDEVTKLQSEGKSVKEIADQTGMTERFVMQNINQSS